MGSSGSAAGAGSSAAAGSGSVDAALPLAGRKIAELPTTCTSSVSPLSTPSLRRTASGSESQPSGWSFTVGMQGHPREREATEGDKTAICQRLAVDDVQKALPR